MLELCLVYVLQQQQQKINPYPGSCLVDVLSRGNSNALLVMVILMSQMSLTLGPELSYFRSFRAYGS